MLNGLEKRYIKITANAMRTICINFFFTTQVYFNVSQNFYSICDRVSYYEFYGNLFYLKCNQLGNKGLLNVNIFQRMLKE